MNFTPRQELIQIVEKLTVSKLDGEAEGYLVEWVISRYRVDM